MLFSHFCITEFASLCFLTVNIPRKNRVFAGSMKEFTTRKRRRRMRYSQICIQREAGFVAEPLHGDAKRFTKLYTVFAQARNPGDTAKTTPTWHARRPRPSPRKPMRNPGRDDAAPPRRPDRTPTVAPFDVSDPLEENSTPSAAAPTRRRQTADRKPSHGRQATRLRVVTHLGDHLHRRYASFFDMCIQL